MVNSKAISYRPMQASDYESCYKLWIKTPGMKIEAADSRESIAAYLHKNQNLSLVAMSDNQVIGTVLCGEDGRRGYLQHLCVEPDYRRKSVASELVTRAVMAFKERDLYEVRLFIFTDNDLGNNFWGYHNWVIRDDIYVRTFQLSGKD